MLGIAGRGTSIARVATEERRISRYEAAIATFVGVCALFVSGYTAYVQRQQVRAAVLPILEYTTSNEPKLRFTVENKGVGPAIIGHVIVSVDGKPMPHWQAILQELAGPGPRAFSQSTVSGRVFAAGESIDIFTPYGPDGQPLTRASNAPFQAALDKGRGRVGVEICYCSTLGECWILRSGSSGNSTTPIGACPEPSANTFQE